MSELFLVICGRRRFLNLLSMDERINVLNTCDVSDGKTFQVFEISIVNVISSNGFVFCEISVCTSVVRNCHTLMVFDSVIDLPADFVCGLWVEVVNYFL